MPKSITFTSPKLRPLTLVLLETKKKGLSAAELEEWITAPAGNLHQPDKFY